MRSLFCWKNTACSLVRRVYIGFWLLPQFLLEVFCRENHTVLQGELNQSTPLCFVRQTPMEKTVSLLLLFSVLFFPFAATLPFHESRATSPITLSVGIISPTNQTCTANGVTLNVTFVSIVESNMNITLTYSLDGNSNQTLPLTVTYREDSFQATITGQTVVSGLASSMHWVTVYVSTHMGIAPPQTITDHVTVHFTITDANLTGTQKVNSWTQKANMSTPRYNAGATAVNGTIFVLGGLKTQINGSLHFSNCTAVNEAYDPQTNTWIQKAPLPVPLSGFAVAAYAGKIYCFGGAALIGEREIMQNGTFVYDPALDVWQSSSPMPEPASGLEANVIDGKIYLVGNLTLVYDPVTDSWATKTSPPTAVVNYASAVVDDKIFVMGGNTGGPTFVSFNQIYDPSTDTWTQGAPMPKGVSNAAAAATLTAIYVFGGTTQEYPLNGQNLTQIYFPQNNSWSMGADMPKTKAGQTAVAVDNVFYVLGGGHNIFAPDSTDNLQYVPAGNELCQTTENSVTVAPSSSLLLLPSHLLPPL